MCDAKEVPSNPGRGPSSDEYRKRQAERDSAGYGAIQGAQAMDTATNRVMDKRVVVNMLHNRVGELRRNADGVERLAQLMSAAGDHDYQLFAVILDKLQLR